jgi:uncharacterized protein
MLDLSSVPLLDHHSHAGLYERRLGRHQTLADLDTADPHYASSAYRTLLREAYADLYGDPASWASGVDAQYADGTERAYSRMLERLGITATLWDYRQLARNEWPFDRYRMVYWIDPLVCPFPDQGLSRGDELQAALAEALGRGGLSELPEPFEEYLAFVDRMLRLVRPELVGLKLLLGYHRPLEFQNPSFFDARDAYQRLRRGESTPYRIFQDFMVRQLYQLAGALDLPLQIHASFGGPSSGLHLVHNDPALLQSLFGQPDRSATRVVLLHGGYPYLSQAAALAWMYPRVYLDFSVLPSLFALPLARWLEEWLELLPRDKLLFGSDASAPELYYTAAVNGRRQLGRALDNLVTSGGLSRAEALQVAERVCFKNAATLYRLGDL